MEDDAMSSPASDVNAILAEAAERLNLFSNQIALRHERNEAHRIAQAGLQQLLTNGG